MNYVETVRAAIVEELARTCPDWDIAATPHLLDSYALLVLTVGEAVTREQVHDAWSLWSNHLGPVHRYLIPYGDLPAEVQAQDEVGRAAIAAVAEARRPTRSDAYVGLSGTPIARTRSFGDGIHIDYDGDGEPGGVEVLGASGVTIDGLPAPISTLGETAVGRATDAG